MSTNSRPTRSRMSSPFVSGSKNTTIESSSKSAETSTKPKTFMDRWIEPERPAPRPSFAEAGLERHNVVQNMAPLGTLPSQKIRKSVLGKPEGSDGIARLTNARKSAPSPVSTPSESVMTPEPPTESQRRESVSTNKTEEKVEEVVRTPTPKTPQYISSPQKSVSRPSVPPQSSGQGVFALQRSPIPSTTPVFRPAPFPAHQTLPQSSIMNHNGYREVNFELCDKVVEVAVQEALDRYRYPTAYALRTLYDDHKQNVRIVRLIESIYTESATDEQRTEFNSIMKHKKKEGRKGRTAEYYFNGDGSDPAPSRPIFNTIVAITAPAVPYISPYAERPSSVAASEPRASASSLKYQSPAPVSVSDSKELDHIHVSKKQKMNHHQHDVFMDDLGNENDSVNGMDHVDDTDHVVNTRAESNDSIPAVPNSIVPPIEESPVKESIEMSNEPPVKKQSEIQFEPQLEGPTEIIPNMHREALIEVSAKDLRQPSTQDDLDVANEPYVESPVKAIEGLVETLGEAPIEKPSEDPSEVLLEAATQVSPAEPPIKAPSEERGGSPVELSIVAPVEKAAVDAPKSTTHTNPNPNPKSSFDEIHTPTKQNSQKLGKENDEREEGQKEEQRRLRSRSNSSSSSLSSVSEDAIDGAFASAKNSPAVKNSINPHFKSAYPGLTIFGAGNGNVFGLPVQQPAAYGSPYISAESFSAVAETAVRKKPKPAQPAQPAQPITKPGPKFHTFAVTPSTSSANAAPPSSSTNSPANTFTNANTQPSTNPSMAPAALVPSSTTSSVASGQKSGPTFRIKNFKKLQGHQVLDQDDETALLKRKARETAQANYNPIESHDRHKVAIATPPDIDSQSDGPDFIQVASSKRPTKKQRKNALKLKSRETRHSSTRLGNYDSEDNNNHSSPPTLGFNSQIAPGSITSSRAATPSVSSRQPARKARAGTGLRIKSSPMKKTGGTSAGIPRGVDRHQSPVGNNVPSTTQNGVENDEFCAACGGNGNLVCCDGQDCSRSFHYKCADPPVLDPDALEKWYCNACDIPGEPLENFRNSGVFAVLLYSIHEKCPRAFNLPAPIRDYFENVKTGTEGEYEELQPAKPKNPKGWEEAPDYFRLKDAKGNAIFCHDCGGQAEEPARSIINCTYCGLYWHMDCLPVPLAREPGPGRAWKCPAHVDDVLAKLPGALGPAHRFRRIKGAPIIKPAFSRGMRNNGHIEIENDLSDNEEKQDFFVQKEYGHIYKLPERGIKLDFITKVKQMGGGFRRDLPHPRPRATVEVNNWNSRTLEDQQAALNLASMIVQSSIPEQTTCLINTLMVEAPPAVIALIAQGSSGTVGRSKMTKSDKQSMSAVIQALQARLAAANDEDEEPTQSSNGFKNSSLNISNNVPGEDRDIEMTT